jgi:pSer/pThr/pTyr-binding forkhead associated (FHA) protein
MDDRDKTTIIKSNTDIHKQITEAFTHIELFFKGSEYSLKRDDLPLTAGRDLESCAFVTDNTTASRKHCTLEVKDGQVGIRDHSTNGTYIKIGRAETVLIKNSFYPLISQGNISFGEPINLESKEILYFRVISKPKTEE